jgi:hypothetical protein
MSLNDQINQELARIRAAGGGGTLTADAPNGRIECDLTNVDAIGCAVDRFSFHTGRLTGASLERLKKIGEDLSRRVTYLLEPIAIIELDAEGITVQLRSSPPSQENGVTTYYELTINPSGLNLRRYQSQSGQPRQAVPAHFTHEALRRLAKDVTAAVP